MRQNAFGNSEGVRRVRRLRPLKLDPRALPFRVSTHRRLTFALQSESDILISTSRLGAELQGHNECRSP